MNRVTLALSFTGFVFGMQATAVKPPATAAAAPGGDRLLVLVPRLAQVHVHVDEARADDQRRPEFDDHGVRPVALGGIDDVDARDAAVRRSGRRARRRCPTPGRRRARP